MWYSRSPVEKMFPERKQELMLNPSDSSNDGGRKRDSWFDQCEWALAKSLTWSATVRGTMLKTGALEGGGQRVEGA